MKVWIGIAAVVAAVALYMGFAPGPPDREQIQQALKNSVKASKEGRPGGVLEYLSDNFTINNVQYNPNDMAVAKAIKQYRPDVTVTNNEPQINGDKATITSNVRLSIPLVGRGVDIPQVTFTFQKQKGTKWLVFPSKDWKLQQVSVPQSVVDEIAAQFQ
jgi:hypothetical protein